MRAIDILDKVICDNVAELAGPERKRFYVSADEPCSDTEVVKALLANHQPSQRNIHSDLEGEFFSSNLRSAGGATEIEKLAVGTGRAEHGEDRFHSGRGLMHIGSEPGSEIRRYIVSDAVIVVHEFRETVILRVLVKPGCLGALVVKREIKVSLQPEIRNAEQDGKFVCTQRTQELLCALFEVAMAGRALEQ